MMQNDIKVPIAPKSIIVIKLRKNCFFFTWNLERLKNKREIEIAVSHLIKFIQIKASVEWNIYRFPQLQWMLNYAVQPSFSM